MSPRDLDVILYGATGFTGRQTAEYFARHAPADLRWAIAGRNQTKLASLHTELSLGKSVGIIAADSADGSAIAALCARTRVVLTTAGPFALYGHNLVKSCAESGTHYVDITGETAFIRDMIDSYQTVAVGSGAKLVPLCGFDSVPADLGNYILAKHLSEVANTATARTYGYYSIGGGFNGGTFLSGLTMLETGAYQRMADPALLLPKDASGVKLPADDSSARYADDVKSWVAPFVMGRINTRVVHRSAALAASYGTPYGDNFGYSEAMKMGGSWNPIPAVGMAAGMRAFETLGSVAAVRNLLRSLGPSAGQGPSPETIAGGFYTLEIFGKGDDGTRAKVTFADRRDPGNRATVQFVCEAALSLVQDQKRLPGGEKRCGFLTPATAFGDVLVERLRAGETTIRAESLS